MSDLRQAIDAAKARLPLPSLLSILDLTAHAKQSAKCPFHEDRSPSFSVWHGAQGWQWKCQSGCGNGDEISFLEIYFRISRPEAIRRFVSIAGDTIAAPFTIARKTPSLPSTGPSLPDDASPGTEADWRALADLRRIDYRAAGIAATLGTLYFGTVCGFRCWIIADERRVCAEARRMDGQSFPTIGDLGARKAHTIKGSVKSWPVGLAVRGNTPADFRALLIVEGGPDYLAALHFTLAHNSDCLPVAFLGAGVGSAIHSEALPLLRGLRGRLYPHHESNGVGVAAARKWAAQFADAGAHVDAFSFADLRKADGSPVKDLNDCTSIHPDDAHELEGLLP